MICPNCGKEAPGKFCPHCGMKISGDSAPVQVPDPQAPQAAPNRAPDPGYRQAGYTPAQPQNPNPIYQNQPGAYAQAPAAPAAGYQQPAYAAPQTRSSGDTPAQAALRKTGRSGAFLLAVLCTTISLILSIVSGIMNMSKMSSYYGYYYNSSAKTSTIISLIVSALIMGGMVAALWTVYGNCKGNKPLKTGGLTTFKVYAIIGIVFLGIATVILLVGLIIALLNSDLQHAFGELGRVMNQYGLDSSFSFAAGMLWLGIAIIVLVLVFLYFFLAKIITSVNAAKRIIRSGNPDRKISAFLGVICFIGFAGVVISLVSTVIQVLNYPSSMVDWGSVILSSLLPLVMSAISEICFGIVIFKARGGQKALM